MIACNYTTVGHGLRLFSCYSLVLENLKWIPSTISHCVNGMPRCFEGCVGICIFGYSRAT